MRASELREVIVIEEAAETRSSSGQVIRTWATYATTRAAVEPLRGEEFFAARQMQSATTVKMRIRHISGLNPKMRVLHDGRYYEIEGIIDLGNRRRELQLMCKEREATGWRA